MARRGTNSGVLEAPYQKVRKLGEGGMAETYLCVRREPGEPGDPRTRKTTIEDRACCKRLRTPERPEFRADLEREAAIVASLRHSNITQLRNWHIAERELYFELIDGCDLRQLVTEVPGKKLDSPLVALIGIELCKALAYAHSRTRHGKPAGIVHRDISLANIMISYAGEVKLTDFGLAAVVALEQRGGEPFSRTVRGKLCYMAPEQAKGDRFADHRADLFSLGVVLYELIAGRRPAVGSDDEIFAALDSGSHMPIRELAPEVPEELERIIERLLRPNPAQRFRSADETLDALAALAPPHNLFRSLGVLARQAVPPETLTYTAFGDDHVLDDESVASKHSRAAPLDETPEPVEDKPRATKRRVTSRLIGGAVALSLGVAGLAILPAAHSGSVETVPDVVAMTPPAPDLAVQPVEPPTTAEVGTPSKIQEDGDALPKEASLALVDTATHAAAEPVERASLQVGVVPIAKVWVDGRYLGWSWSPINVKLDPDVEHVVAAGERKAEVKQAVRLAAGERRAITLHLPQAK